MTKCTTKTIEITRCKGRKIQANFNGGEITSDAGALLVRQADNRGIRVILDGVFNHTSSDSRYFDKYSHYPTLGAYESTDSPFYDWYTFTTWPDEYNGWWGFHFLPVLTEIPEVRDFLYGGRHSIAQHWLIVRVPSRTAARKRMFWGIAV